MDYSNYFRDFKKEPNSKKFVLLIISIQNDKNFSKK